MSAASRNKAILAQIKILERKKAAGFLTQSGMLELEKLKGIIYAATDRK